MNYNQIVQQVINISPSVGAGGGVQNIATLTPVSDKVVAYRTAFGTNGVTVGLPDTVNCTFDGGGSGTVGMTWAIGSYNSGAQGSVVAFYTDGVYNIVGTPVTTGSITNTGNITDTVQVTVKTPWSTLVASTVELIYDAKQLATNTNNGYGTVDASNNCTVFKSGGGGIGRVGINLNSSGTAPKLSGGRLIFLGTGFYVQPSATTDFNFLHFHATASLLKHTTIFAGNVTDTNTATGIAGNNGFNAAANGCCFITNSTGALQEFSFYMPANGVDSISWINASMTPYGSDTVLTFVLDNALAHASGKGKGYRGTTLYSATSTGTALCDNTPAATAWEIGTFGNAGAGDMSGSIAMEIYLSGTPESDAIRNKLVEDVAFYTGITL